MHKHASRYGSFMTSCFTDAQRKSRLLPHNMALLFAWERPRIIPSNPLRGLACHHNARAGRSSRSSISLWDRVAAPAVPLLPARLGGRRGLLTSASFFRGWLQGRGTLGARGRTSPGFIQVPVAAMSLSSMFSDQSTGAQSAASSIQLKRPRTQARL